MKFKANIGLLLSLLIIGVFIAFPILAQQNSSVSNNKAILFYGDGCPHCGKVESFISEHNLEAEIIRKEIYHNPQNALKFNEMCESKRISLMNRGVPTLFANNQCYIGDQQIVSYFENNIKKNISNNTENNLSTKQNGEQKNKALTVPLVISAALVDAINPCAFAVLLILMMTVLAIGERKKALYSGLSFSLSIFISYFLMGLGLYSVVVNFQTSQIFMKIIGIVAIILGLLNLKDFFWYGKGFLMEVPLSWRSNLKKIISKVTNPFGAFLTGFLVSLFLLPCTSGPYIVIIGMLGSQATHNLAIKLLILYNLIFILPMILISFATYFGLNVQKAEEKRSKNLKWLHLIAGIIMFLMGIYLLTGF